MMGKFRKTCINKRKLIQASWYIGSFIISLLIRPRYSSNNSRTHNIRSLKRASKHIHFDFTVKFHSFSFLMSTPNCIYHSPSQSLPTTSINVRIAMKPWQNFPEFSMHSFSQKIVFFSKKTFLFNFYVKKSFFVEISLAKKSFFAKKNEPPVNLNKRVVFPMASS
jgi:hypothetical protein